MTLGDEPLKTMRAMIDRLLPPDDDWPGALGAGVEHYITRQLNGDLADRAAMILKGLDELARSSFANLTPSDQDTILRDIEKTEFFTTMVHLTAEGFYADPG